MDPPRPTSGLILDRFNALIRVQDDVVQVYEELLLELTINSKPIITELTMIAGDQREYAEGIADAILARIVEVPVDQKLPALYLLDSIVKNIGREYVRYFAARLPEVFYVAYNEVNPSMHPALRHLFKTWSQVFPSSVLRKIENVILLSTPESQRPHDQVIMRNSVSPSPHTSHGIHVNPKYLEARRAAMGSIGTQKIARTADFADNAMETLVTESSNGWSGASPKIHMGSIGTQKIARAADFEDNAMEALVTESSNGWSGASPKIHMGSIGTQKIARTADFEDNTMETLVTESSNGWSGASPKIHDNLSQPRSYNPNSIIKYGAYDYNKPEISNIGRSKAVDVSINHINARISKPLSPSRLRSRRSTSPVDYKFPRETSLSNTSEKAYLPHSEREYELTMRYYKKRSRDLIDAYGNYRGQASSFEKTPKLQRINVDGNTTENVAKNWRSFEEEEYEWEDMSPTLSSKRNSLHSLGRVGLSQPDAGALESESRLNNWNGQAFNQHRVGDPSITVDDRIRVVGSAHGSMHMRFSDVKGIQNEQFNRHRNPEIFSQNSQHASRENMSMSRAWGSHMPFPVNGVTRTNGAYTPDIELPYQRLSSEYLGSQNRDTSLPEKHLELRPSLYHSVPKSQPIPSLTLPQNPNQFTTPYSLIEPNNKQDNQESNPSLLSSPHQHASNLMHSTQRGREPGLHGAYIPPLPQPLNQIRMQPIGALLNNIPQIANSGVMHNVSGGAVIPPLPHGSPPVSISSHMMPPTQSTISVSSSPVSAFSGLISTLMAQGVISLTPPAQTEVCYCNSTKIFEHLILCALL